MTDEAIAKLKTRVDVSELLYVHYRTRVESQDAMFRDIVTQLEEMGVALNWKDLQERALERTRSAE